MARVMMLVCMVMVLGSGCDKDKPPSERAGAGKRSGPDGVIDEMERLADELCKCRDRACGERVMKQMSSMKEPDAQPTKEQMERAMMIAERMATCQKKLMTADAPPTGSGTGTADDADDDAAGDDGADGASPGAEPAIRKMGELADRLCDCKDMPCAEGVMKEMSAMKDPGGKPTKEQMERAMTIAERMAGCHQKLAGAEAPPAPPPPPVE